MTQPSSGEELGYDSLWVGEHVVVPDPRRPPSPMEPGDPILDGLVSLAYLAAHTERVRLATGIVILPQRNPVVLAKQLASLDVITGGRLIFGIGVGYLEAEMSAVGVPMERRGARAAEYLAAMRALWEQEHPAFEGEFVRFADINAYPRPVQHPLPVVRAATPARPIAGPPATPTAGTASSSTGSGPRSRSPTCGSASRKPAARSRSSRSL